MAQVKHLQDVQEAVDYVNFYVDKQGATSIKFYMWITRAQMKAIIDIAHSKGILPTGHLCSVTWTEAIGMGIDNLEHGLVAVSDFIKDKVPDQCDPSALLISIFATEDDDPRLADLINLVVQSGTRVTSTLSVLEQFVPGSPMPLGLEALAKPALDQFILAKQAASQPSPLWPTVFNKSASFERRIFRANPSLLLSGADPTGLGGILGGFADIRNLELLVSFGGLSPMEALRVYTVNPAQFLKVDDKIGKIAKGYNADLVVVGCDILADIKCARDTKIVFKSGMGYDPNLLLKAAEGKVI